MRTIFITGTDTGVGKTLLTALLLSHLRQTGHPALALKPFCSGGRGDAELLWRLQDKELSLDEVNPFFFPEPLAPLAAARKERRAISLEDVMAHIRSVQQRLVQYECHCSGAHTLHASGPFSPSRSPASTLLIEGSGGLLVPLGDCYTVLDLLVQLDCEPIIVSRNRLGTINHTLLTLHALRRASASGPRASSPAIRHRPSGKVVLMNRRAPDASAVSNVRLLAEMIAPVPLISFPFLEIHANSLRAIRRNTKKIKKTLARLLD